MKIDMQEVVGKRDILMLCLDTLRYDVAVEEEKSGGTPILSHYGGKWEKRHAPGNFTYPSHFAIFAGFFPSPADPHDFKEREWLFYPKRVGTSSIAPQGSYEFTKATFVESLFDEGYETICIGGVRFFSKLNDIGKVFPGYFHKSYWKPAFGCPEKDSATSQIDFALKKLNEYPIEKKIFLYINFSAIHYPNYHYIKGKTEDDLETHAAALRYVDSQLPRLFDAFGKRGEPLVIAFSDHGTCYGEDGFFRHCVSHDVVYTVPYKHFILR
ncbi:arylsulfatase A-like enzyme [Parabacteroides sp. PF5-5]|uniref:STM4013/SEN3800 family hydrolase n=1 Tax=unclassified Parabacteroides TaxID=2649774 RepID=UPI0024731EA4|nr:MULTISPECIES: STM4013/SEN3800 family hydrolase [unclassified Parabacteroides]MDH6307045.1 arylsulfatase A-like enzyme [Parabacteroides sp. PH5-39]MDH6317960.1 arylsulfatase A-like enzyme [Parabacteroides sp. PF5-13]MDH6321687.1 arylsulfatase A-like enzyme [Parabacteroides sp. PH5-13]MDH6325438.1 arylsulfatase A-like enzyme [Parabacteroides sp. PH5-8]MDH6329149.1 arylsulfatase A-like enzyme [Parabacteroides sp. PH5-41]